jgi:uncharacterized RDD family membrane protein YckC
MKGIDFESAQHVKVEYELASAGIRTLAAMIDFASFVLYYVIMSMVFSLTQPFDASIGSSEFFWLLLVKIPWIFYYPVIEYITKGQSLGKYAVGIRVVTLSGERPGLREVFTRWIFRGDFLWIAPDLFALGWFVMGAIGVVVVSISPKKQRVGDSMASTVVIKNKSSVSYSLRDVLAIKDQSTHQPIYPEVVRFTDEDMMLIKNTIQRVRTYPNEETKKFATELAEESSRLIGLEKVPEKRLEFLQTLLQDYVVLTR